ncbi:hypothetical protein AUJ87_02600 [Candidatus Gracilibacteria bacterium CG1_02_38_174]|nr:MAG: hypothetical protein AUJ87_02600 [Candidatus Gracilibacteria bacterium CG1_02_38_174]PIZ01573.1 MAG: hypothetical protein COY60_02775 [Candidatus Gracilibacteria bacterium CG_4_10_14_0_8_um_filter_38_28]
MNYFDQVFFRKYLRDREELIFVCHRHPLLIVDRVIVILFIGLALPTFFYYNNSFSFQTLVPFLYFETYAIALYFFLVYKIFDWYNDVWILTNLGVIDIDWNVFTRHVIYIDYHDIKGSEIQINSFFDSFFNKGDVILYTMGDDDDFVLEGAENPHEISDQIEEVIHEMAERKEHQDRAPMELLLHTLTEVVRDHLEGNESRGELIDKEEKEEEIERVLTKKGTIDLR